jgi:PAS domain S-box-containing protein
MAICARAEDLLAAILSSTEDGLLSFTLEGIVQSGSRGAELLYGYREAEIVGQPLGQLLPSNDAPQFDGSLHAAIRGEFPQCENTERLRKDGWSVLLAVSRTPIRNEHGDIVGIVEIGKTPAASSIETVSEEHLKAIRVQAKSSRTGVAPRTAALPVRGHHRVHRSGNGHYRAKEN